VPTGWYSVWDIARTCSRIASSFCASAPGASSSAMNAPRGGVAAIRRQADTVDEDVGVRRLGEVPRIDQRRGLGIGRAKCHLARAPRLHGDRGDRDAVLGRAAEALVDEEHGREQQLELRAGEVWPGSHERNGLPDVGAQRPAPAQEPSGQVPERLGAVEGHRVARPAEDAVGEMVEQVAPDACHLVSDVDAHALEHGARPDAGQLQELRRVDRSCADDHRTPSVRLPLAPV
jgi:hypothetical protein